MVTTPARLQIIDTGGQIQFRTLNENRGLTSIGRDRANDIVIEDSHVAPFQAMIDHRQEPYRLMILNGEGHVILEGQVLPDRSAVELRHLAQIELGQYRLILHQDRPRASSAPAAPDDAVAASSPPAVPMPATASGPVRPAPVSRPTTAPEAGPSHPAVSSQPEVATPVRQQPAATDSATGTGGGVGAYKSRPADQSDPAIFVDLSEQEWTLNAGEQVTFEVTITNAGPRLADFRITLDGVDETWLTLPPPVSLYEKESETVPVVIDVPKLPTSHAGPHHIRLMVYSPTYRNRFSQRGATLTIRPFYEFGLSKLEKIRPISWFRPYGETEVTVSNKSNAPAAFQLEGSSEEKSCSFEFEVPDEQIRLTRQAPLHLPPQPRPDPQEPDPAPMPHVAPVPIRVLPHKRPLFLRSQTHRFEIGATLLDEPNASRAVLGELKQKPLLGLIPLLLLGLFLLLSCASGVWFTFGPRVETFTVNGQINPQSIKSGQEVMLEWQASPFANLKIEPEIGWLENHVGQRPVTPLRTTNFTLEASNFLSDFLPFPAIQIERKVVVDPVKPSIEEFEANPAQLVTGQELLLSWEVANADEVTLTRGDGLPETIPTTEHTGERVLLPNQSTTYGLTARNIYDELSQNVEVIVVTPTGTPVPTPGVDFFNVNPTQIIQGEAVTINWSVTGADSVVINPLPGSLPPQGSISQAPQSTTLYVLEASKEGAGVVRRIQEVTVLVPTGTPSPTPTPAAPIIVDFNASKTELVVGEGGDDSSVTLFWTVQGEVTDIQLANSQNVIIQSQLEPESQFEVPVSEDSTLFTLIAYNEDKSSRKSVTLDLATPTPEPPLPTATPGAPIIVFKAEVTSSEDATKVEQIAFDEKNQVRTYEVEARTKISLNWEVTGADSVTLESSDENYGSQPLQGKQDIRDPIIGDQTFTLEVKRNGRDKPEQAFIEIEVGEFSPPPPSFNVTGDPRESEEDPIIRIQWEYPIEEERNIEGFRLYRADLSTGTDFRRLPDEIPPSRRDWDDKDFSSPDDLCGKAYYVVATYRDLDGNLLETDASENSWYSDPCP